MSERVMIIEYDYENDILFFYDEENYKYEFSEHLDKSVTMDFNKNKLPIGLEISNASKLFKTEKFRLKSINDGCLNIEISKKKISINIHMITKIHNKPTPMNPINVNSNNSLGIPNMTTELSIATA